ncbi:MAG: AMP-binding protein [Bacteroidota bacterium]|nr:AMP-binding protein [Bacteroidota bacterium]
MNIVNLFLEAAEQYPDKVALIHKGMEITYAQLKVKVLQQVAYLQEKNILKGDKVLVYIPMSIDLYIMLLAIFYNGSVAVFIDEWANKERISQCCRMIDCKGFAGGWKATLFAWFNKDLRTIPLKVFITKQTNIYNHLPVEMEENVSALITLTSGSTGIPKAANRTHGFLFEQFNALEHLIAGSENFTELCTLPIVTMLNLGHGKTTVIPSFKTSKPKTFIPENIYSDIERYYIESIVASPYYTASLGKYGVENKFQNYTVKHLVTGGGPVFPDVAKDIVYTFPDAKNMIVYGSTEAEPISHIDANKLQYYTLENGLPVGIPDAQTELCIIQFLPDTYHEYSGNEWENIQCSVGQFGEIVVKGKHVLENYLGLAKDQLNNKIKTNSGLWHRTGDAGRLGNDGVLYLLGRCKESFVYHNTYVFPFILEYTLKNISGIKEGTIIQINNIPIIFFVPSADFDKAFFTSELSKLGLGNIETRKLDSLPKDPRHHTKIDYNRLKNL